MSEQPMQARPVSIVVNNYNYGRFLAAAIDSALLQADPNVQVVVVDDGTTDNSRETIAGYRDRIVPVLKANGGQAPAFNAGFAVCRGEVVIFFGCRRGLCSQTTERVRKRWRAGLSKVQYCLECERHKYSRCTSCQLESELLLRQRQ